MARSNARTRRASKPSNSESEEASTAATQQQPEPFPAKSDQSNLGIPVSPSERQPSTETTTEAESTSSKAASSEEISSNTSDSAADSDKSSSTSSETSADELSKKTKDELVRLAQDLDSKYRDLIKMYQHEKKLFVDKSIHQLERGEHPDWVAKIEDQQKKRHDTLNIARQRYRLRMESIIAEHDFCLKNIGDELEAADKEITDEFTSKRKKQKQNITAPASERIEFDRENMQKDIELINRRLEKSTEVRSTPTEEAVNDNEDK